MRSPFELPDIKKAVAILKDAYKNKNQTIVFYGDRDADGISSLAILYLFFRDQLKYPREELISLTPREDDKYGITEQVVDRILDKKPDILITLDCGSSNHKEIDYLLKRYHKPSLKIIIIDHHFIPNNEQDYPNVEAFINPKKCPLGDPNRELCTAGLAYKLIWALTYSFTSEYEKLYEISGFHSDGAPIYFKNLVQDFDQKQKKVQNITLDNQTEVEENKSISQGEHCSIQLLPLWNHTVASHSFFAQIQSFVDTVGFSLSTEDQSRFLFQTNLQNTWAKTRNYLVFAAIGSIADMVPLIDDNRVIVKEGLSLVNQNFKVGRPLHPSLQGVLSLVRLLFSQQNKIGEEDFVFSICPAINSAGRLGQPNVAFDSLIESDRLLAVKKASELKKLNEKRKKISKSITEEIILRLSNTIDKKNILIVYDPQIHRGISGLIANHLCEHFNKPALVLVDDGDSIRGSIRSSQNQDVFSFLAKLEHFFIQFGGHKQAAGFSLESGQREAFTQEAEKLSKSFFVETLEVEQQNKNNIVHNEDFQAIPIYDYEINASLWKECRFFAPFGKNNPTPVFAIKLTKPIEYENLGKTGDHVKIKFLALTNDLIEGVWFFHKGEIKKLNQNHSTEQESQKILLAEPSINTWRGRTIYRLKITQLLFLKV